MISDGELLRRYVEDGSEAAFTELVQRHINVVYLAALRRVGRNAHAADDVTQRVFTDLAHKARTLKERQNLAGWLYTGTRFAAAQVVRAEQRRRVYEERAHTMNELDSNSPLAADRLDPFLDEVMDLLSEQDREAVLLHFFEGRSFADVGTILSLSADASRMRVNRALERLRSAFAQRGIASCAAALGTALSTQSVFAVPQPLASSVARAALSHASAFPTSATVVSRFMEAAKSSPLAATTGGALVVILVALAIQALPSSHSDDRGGLNVEWFPRDATVQPLSTSPAENVVAASRIQPSDESNHAPIQSRLRSDFASLSPEEKNLVAMLWSQRHRIDPGNHPGLRIGRLAPNFAGINPLLARGWVVRGRMPGQIYLTKLGEAFCESHTAEIDTHVPFSNPPKLPG